MTATIITIAQRKGGAGKTTLAAHLAVTWANKGRVVTLIDTDPQASLSHWYQRREERLGQAGTGLSFVAASGWRAVGEITQRARTSDIVLIDSPANTDADARAAIRSAGLVLVPVQPSPVDVWATLPTLDIARQERVPALLVLNRVPARACLTASMRTPTRRLRSGPGAERHRQPGGARSGFRRRLGNRRECRRLARRRRDRRPRRRAAGVAAQGASRGLSARIGRATGARARSRTEHARVSGPCRCCRRPWHRVGPLVAAGRSCCPALSGVRSRR